MRTWVMVADAGRARIFASGARNQPLLEQADLVNPEQRLKNQDLLSDRPARAVDMIGGVRHPTQQSVDPKTQSAIRFAKVLGEELDAGLRKHDYDRLFLAAAPRFLGLLRDHLSGSVAAVVVDTLDKDLSRETVDTIRAQFDERW